jgi:aspartate carbamoyltransferase catalytic subunit
MTPSIDLRGRDLLSAADLSAIEIGRIFDTARDLKDEFRRSRRHVGPPLVGRTLAMLFQKPSLRTRVPFEAGMAQLGGTAIYLPEDSVMGAREAVRDVAHNLGRSGGADHDRYRHQPAGAGREAVLAEHVDAEEDRLGEERKALEDKREAEDLAPVLHEGRPEKPELE